jgi:hypothetical protein
MRNISFGSLAIAAALLMLPTAAGARGGHHFGGHHGMIGMNAAGEAHMGDGRHVDEAYAKAVSTEHERLLGKLKDICRGC